MQSLSQTCPASLQRHRRGKRLRWIDAVFRVQNDRVSLAEMPEHLRCDIGLSNRQIEDEIRRPF
ncbi:DUF1127 domain-containing protein [Ovoidimarina sediminis]|uniref:hypothetical protein n=1 Tax=Ovoidimarina sediminis TaxID=3079856 RepID=UPI00290AC261|nr:hypothetical protein [Rhodophyticola sp. MJ-SS7]MDU8945397.1 hypothetical protein [Rhodophyticola sp. MJ-SS7]